MTPAEALDILRSFDTLGETYSNLNGVMPDNLADRLRLANKNTCCEHPAWDHWGLIWFADDRFHEMVMQYHRPVAIISADSPQEVWENVNERFGYE